MTHTALLELLPLGPDSVGNFACPSPTFRQHYSTAGGETQDFHKMLISLLCVRWRGKVCQSRKNREAHHATIGQ